MHSTAAVFPGSFDPITLGHVDIILRATGIFDKVYVAVGSNTSKKYWLPLATRLLSIRTVFENTPNVEVVSYQTLTTQLCRSVGASYMVRGLRSTTDFNYELAIAHNNALQSPDIETIVLLSRPEHTFISSSIVRELYLHHGDISALVPKEIIQLLPKPEPL